MNILAENVDLLQKHDVFFHDSGILLLVDVLVLLEHLSQIINIIFEVLALVSILSVEVSISLLILDLFLDILFVEADHTLLQLLEVGNVMKTFKDVILELLLEALLLIKILSQMSDLIGQAFLTHAQVIDNKSQVLVNTIEMLELLTHLVSLLVKLLDFNFTGSNVTLKLLNLVIQDELELFELLGLLFEIVNSLILITDCCLTLLDLTLL